MTKGNIPEADLDSLIRQVLKDDLPPEVEGRMNRQFLDLKRTLDQPRRTCEQSVEIEFVSTVGSTAAPAARMRCAQRTTRSPSAVKPSKRGPRRTSGTPSSASSRRTPADSVGCETWHARAARPKWRSRSSATR